MGKSDFFPYHGRTVTLCFLRVDFTSSVRNLRSTSINSWQIPDLNSQRYSDADLEFQFFNCFELSITSWRIWNSKGQRFGTVNIRLHTVIY